MMKKSFLLTLFVALLAACAPERAATESPAVGPVAATLAAPMTESVTEVAPNGEGTALPVVTPRGPDLEATDPTTVSLASGGLQFVEFFRFT